jgi:hypothetical protein
MSKKVLFAKKFYVQFWKSPTKNPSLFCRFKGKILGEYLQRMVGATGFEPAAFCTQSRRDTKLRYAPISAI